MEIPDTPELVEISLDDEQEEELEEVPKEEPEDDIKEDPVMGEPSVDHGIEDTKSAMFGDGIDSYDLGEKPIDEFD